MPEIDQNPYIGPDRRQPQNEQALLLRLLEKIEQLSSQVTATHLSLIESRAEIHKLREDFDNHAKEEYVHIHAIMKAFPERDFDDHHDYHDQKRKAAKSWSEIILDIKKKVFGGVVWAFLLAVGLAVWEYIKVEIRK